MGVVRSKKEVVSTSPFREGVLRPRLSSVAVGSDHRGRSDSDPDPDLFNFVLISRPLLPVQEGSDSWGHWARLPSVSGPTGSGRDAQADRDSLAQRTADGTGERRAGARGGTNGRRGAP